jgi:hypothetical protein
MTQTFPVLQHCLVVLHDPLLHRTGFETSAIRPDIGVTSDMPQPQRAICAPPAATAARRQTRWRWLWEWIGKR